MVDKPDGHLLQEEIESWRPFANSLRSEERVIFKALIEKCWRYSKAIESSKKRYITEPFFLTVLLIQQRTIEWLQSQLDELRREVDKNG